MHAPISRLASRASGEESENKIINQNPGELMPGLKRGSFLPVPTEEAAADRAPQRSSKAKWRIQGSPDLDGGRERGESARPWSRWVGEAGSMTTAGAGSEINMCHLRRRASSVRHWALQQGRDDDPIVARCRRPLVRVF
ncbi:hypothetical protein E4U53_001238 [Claviceps sorghi]|nr:hypothetical protein E4U53_001238 [Claviceps sorghi]